MVEGNKKFSVILKILKIFFSIIFSVTFILPAFSVQLPDKIDEWHSVSEYITPLILNLKSEDVGRCVYKKYSRYSPPGSLEIILTEGSGPGILRFNEKKNNGNSKVAIEADSDYKTLKIAECNALFEKYKILPDVLAISISKDTTLTLESNSMNENEFVNLAGKVIKMIKRSE